MAQRLAAREFVNRPRSVRKLALVAIPLFTLLSITPALAQPTSTDGEQLFIESCATCHGPKGVGGELGPPLTESGAAAADFQLRTGRMPLGDSEQQPVRKESPFTQEQIDALVEYVASFGGGPEIPEVSTTGTVLSNGQELFSDNCAPCHGTTGTGGAVGPGSLAPSLFLADGVEVAEAMVSGPGEMPVFDLSDRDRNEVVAYVLNFQEEEHPGGQDIGGIGPVPEGYVAWLLGGTAIVVLCLFIGHSRKKEES